MARETSKPVGYDYKIGDEVLLTQEGILRKGESPYSKEPWTITAIHMNGTIRIQRRTQSERLNIWRVTPFVDAQIRNSNNYLLLLTILP